jgi:hypothetical protein
MRAMTCSGASGSIQDCPFGEQPASLSPGRIFHYGAIERHHEITSSLREIFGVIVVIIAVTVILLGLGFFAYLSYLTEGSESNSHDVSDHRAGPPLYDKNVNGLKPNSDVRLPERGNH